MLTRDGDRAENRTDKILHSRGAGVLVEGDMPQTNKSTICPSSKSKKEKNKAGGSVEDDCEVVRMLFREDFLKR